MFPFYFTTMLSICGIIKRITFHSDETGFTVLRLESDEFSYPVTCIGKLPLMRDGEMVTFTGDWTMDKRFGKQFSIVSMELTRPTSIKGIKALLNSKLIPGVGPKRADQIIELFGDKTLDILDTSPHKLQQISGIGSKCIEKIKRGWNQHKEVRKLALFLDDFALSLSTISKISKQYGDNAKRILSENPYQLTDDIWGIGFKKADEIASHLNISKESYRRIEAAILHILKTATKDGHIYLPRSEVLEKTENLLLIPNEKIVYALDNMINATIIIDDNDKIYLKKNFDLELRITKLLKKRTNKSKTINAPNILNWIDNYSREKKWFGSIDQIEAVKCALDKSIFILTGGPGTGKTTTLQIVVSYFQHLKQSIALTAPTGRAAQRMGAVAGLEAKTIHRLLEYKPTKYGMQFMRNEDNQINADICICDEVSMLDMQLFDSLLRALAPKTRLILVGDSDQLPSVGAGNVLSDLIESNIIPHVKLNTIFRQAAQSRIVTAAHEIIHGDIPEFKNRADENCFFINEDDPQKALNTICDLVADRLPCKYGIDPINDIQILTPMHRGILGTQNINVTLQDRLNSQNISIERNGVRFALYDKIMQIRNNYDTGIFNGDIGRVIKVSVNENKITVQFSKQAITYEQAKLDDLVLAYCISIHKSQGSEFNTVILPISTQHFIMLQRNLLYTAITRAKKRCILIGTKRALTLAINNNAAAQRYTRLASRLSCNL